MLPRLTRLVILVSLALLTLHFCLPRVQTYAEAVQSSYGSTEGATRCATESPTSDCADDANVISTTITSTSTNLKEQQQQQQRPSTIDYPTGFTKFDTSDPTNPYHAETYDLSEESEGALGRGISSDVSLDVLTRLQAWAPYNRKYNIESQNPVIFQTYRDEPGTNSVPYHSWVEKNGPRWSRTFLDDKSHAGLVTGYARDLQFLNETYHALPSKILKLDFLRYVSLYKSGGVYADVDTSCYRPIESWYESCYSPTRLDGRPSRATQPGLLVGVEFDLKDDPRHDSIDGRRLAISNYVFAANQGHPALAKVIANIVRMTLTPSNHSFNLSHHSDVYAWTGRRMWTDTILAHIADTVQGFTESELLGLTHAKVIDDICVLPIAAFGSGQPEFKNAPERDGDGVFVKHFRMHTWEY